MKNVPKGDPYLHNGFVLQIESKHKRIGLIDEMLSFLNVTFWLDSTAAECSFPLIIIKELIIE